MKKLELSDLEKLINSQLTSMITNSKIENDELLISTSIESLVDVIKFLKTNDECKFRQLIDIAGIDYPQKEKRFNLTYLLLSHEKNLRIKISMDFEIENKIP